MSRVSLRLLFVFCVLFWQSGCVLVQPMGSFARQSWRVFRPDPGDYRDTTSEADDQWAFVGVEGRGDRPMEKEADPFKPFLMSPKARSIERNLGVD